MQWLSEMGDYVSPLSNKMYKVVVLLDHLAPVLEKYVVEPSKSIEALEIRSEPGTVLFTGTVKNQPEDRLHSFGYPRISFLSEFSIEKGNEHLIDLTVKKFRLIDPEEPSVDMVRLASKFLPGIKKYFLRELAKARPELFSMPDLSDVVVMDISYFLNHVPSLMTSPLSEARIIRVSASQNQINFYVETSLLLVKLVDYFGPRYIELQEIQDRDALELLWQDD